MTGRLIIADRSLMDVRGHHFALTEVISRGALEGGIPVVWFANKSFSDELTPAGVVVRGVFEASVYDAFSHSGKKLTRLQQLMRPIAFGLYVVRRISASVCYRWSKYIRGVEPEYRGGEQEASRATTARIFAQALAVEQAGPDDHVLIHTADGEMYRAILEMIVSGSINDESPRFHVVTPYDTHTMPNYGRGLAVGRVMYYLKLMGVIGSRVYLYGEFELLTRQLAEDWGVEVGTLPVPPPAEAINFVKQSDPVLTIAYVGSAREEKGFLLLPRVVKKALAIYGSNVRFVIQCSPQIIGYTPAIESALKVLRGFRKDAVRLIMSSQSMEEYYAVLKQTQVVLACYDQKQYRTRGSGIAVEAIAFGNLLIASPDTSPAYIGRRAAVLAETDDEMVAAIGEIIENRELYRDRAEQRRSEYLVENSAIEYVVKLSSVEHNAPRRNELPADKSPVTRRLGDTVSSGGWERVLDTALSDGGTDASGDHPDWLLCRTARN